MIFVLNCSRVSEFLISRGTMFRIFGPRYLSALKLQLTVFTDPNRSLFMSEGYNGYSSVQKCHALSEQLDFLLFYTTLLLILFFYRIIFFLEIFPTLIHCHCKSSQVHVRVSDLYEYQMFYHSPSTLRDSTQTWI